MALLDEVRKIAGVADRLQGPVGNEANTKALLIEPMLSALGWDTTNLDHVLRDWPAQDNTSIDYALRIGDDNVMLVEARGVNETLDDEPFTARAVESVNGESVLWCVVTNGLIYRVYRTDEKVPPDEKLSFEVDLRKAAVGSPADCANVPLLSRESMKDGSLALWGEQKVFTDPRVRMVLAQLAGKPSAAFLDAINDAIGERKVPRDRLRASLARVLVIESAGSTARAPELAARNRDTARTRDTAGTPETDATPETAETSDAAVTQDGAVTQDTAGTADAAGTPETAKRRFLGGQAKAARETGGEPDASAASDPYAPFVMPDKPFDESDS